MRKALLAGAAMLGTASAAWAQMEATPSVYQSQGMMAMPWAGGPAPNDNNNALGRASPGGKKVPTPGTVVIRLNGRVYAQLDLAWSSLSQVPPGTYGAGTPGFKLNPVGVSSFARLYPGMDGMATNGLRYGASIEIRQNVMGGNNFGGNFTTNGTTVGTTSLATSGSAAGASGNSSAQTLFVRRAFVYLGTDQLGIIRIGQGDGVVSLFDYTGVFTAGTWDGGIGNILNSGVQAVTPNSYLLTWAFLSGNGQEYDANKIVYLSPQFFGFDFALEYDPSQGNAFSNSATSGPYQTGPCASASANCISDSSGVDPTRWLNRFGAGVRYTGKFGGLDVKAYAVYITSGKESHPAVVAGKAVQNYDGLNMVNGGIALTYAGLTFNADATSGRMNGTNGLTPTGGAPINAVLAALSYANGPFSVGVIGAVVDSQGAAGLTKISQRHEVAFAVGGAYKIAPGVTLAAEYQYLQKHQGNFNFASGAAGSQRYNEIKVQGLNIATIVSW